MRAAERSCALSPAPVPRPSALEGQDEAVGAPARATGRPARPPTGTAGLSPRCEGARPCPRALRSAVACQLCPALHGARRPVGPVPRAEERGRRAAQPGLRQAGRRACHPIEKKPFFHFLPGRQAYSLGTVGCPLSCRFCQNWQISQARRRLRHRVHAPAAVADAAARRGTPVVAFTYNEPTVFAEYALDIAAVCRPRGCGASWSAAAS